MFWSLLRDCNYDVFTWSSRSCGASGMFDVFIRSLELFKSSSKYFPYFLLTHVYLLENPHFFYSSLLHCFTAQKLKFSIRDFFSKCDQIHRKLRIWSHLQKTSLMENFIFLCSAFTEEITGTSRLRQWGVPGETMQKGLVMETTV